MYRTSIPKFICGGLLLVVTGSVALDAAPIRIVSCDQKVQSRKRGVCENTLTGEDFRALAPGVSWYYNWFYKTDNIPPAGVKMTFYPMAWGNRPSDLAGLQAYLAGANPKPPVILAINEPNLRGQSFMPPETAAGLYKQITAIGNSFHIPVAGPNMSLGSAEGDSIKAEDPITHQKMTYTFMVPYLKAFFSYLGGADKVPYTAYHSYGNIGELKWATGMMAKTFGHPVWVTEFAQWKNPDQKAALAYLVSATDFLEHSPDVAGYAWFKERVKGNHNISLLEDQPGKLTPMGQAYVSLPPHDSDLYYRIPGKLQSENYVNFDGFDIRPTSDEGGGFVMAMVGSPAWLDYNIQVDTAGLYNLQIRAFGAGKIEIMEGGTVGASVSSTQDGWQTVETKVQLPAGPQTLRVRTSGLLGGLNWIQFSK